MKANVLHGAGQKLEFMDVEDPVAETGEVVVRLTAAALNHRDVWIRKGQYAGLKFPIILGSDGVGEVASVGSGIDSSWVGRPVMINPSMHWGDREEVMGSKFQILGLPSNGTFAEKVKVPVENVFDLPNYLSPTEAATIPLAGLTAFRALRSRAHIQAGENVLITGAGGGTAVIAIQIARAAGATVYVTSGSDAKIESAKDLGATAGVNYRAEDWTAQLKNLVGGFDVIVDSAGGAGFSGLIDLAKPGGRIAFFGATAGNPPVMESKKIYWKQLSILGTTMGSPSDFGAMLQFFEEHQIRPPIDSRFPLDQANEAADHMEAGAQMGKIVLEIG